MAQGNGVSYRFLGHPRRLVRITLEPEQRNEHPARGDYLIVLIAYDVRAVRRSRVAVQHALDRRPSSFLIAKQMQGRADQPVTDQPIRRVARDHGEPVGETEQGTDFS